MRNNFRFVLLGGLAVLFGVACGANGGKKVTDENGDKIADGLGTPVDANGDGVSDGVDRNGDGVIDGISIDTNGDGVPDGVAIDTDGDGIYDGIDTDGDGVVDGTGGSVGTGGAFATGGSGTGATASGGEPGSGGVGTGATATGGSLSSNDKPIFGYVYDVGATSQLDNLPYSNVDVVVHAFVTADSNGNVVGVDGFDGYRNAGIVSKVHAAGKKIVLSLGGAGSTWQMAELIGTPKQATFVANVADKVVEWGYDGIDFDFEFPGNNCTPAQFTSFLNDLKTAVKAKSASNIVMFGISPGWWLQSYEWANLGGVADYGFYFCYDWSMPENGPMTKPGQTFTMEGKGSIEMSCRGAINYILGAGFPANKLVMGVSFAANGGAHYSTASAGVKSGTPDANSMEVSDGSGGWWPNAAGVQMKTSAVLDPSASVLTGKATLAGVGFWQWGYENFASGADLSTAIRTRVDSLE